MFSGVITYERCSALLPTSADVPEATLRFGRMRNVFNVYACAHRRENDFETVPSFAAMRIDPLGFLSC